MKPTENAGTAIEAAATPMNGSTDTSVMMIQ